MSIWRLLTLIWFYINFVYFIDIQTDGDIDLPHWKIKVNKNSRLYRLWMKVAELIERIQNDNNTN